MRWRCVEGIPGDRDFIVGKIYYEVEDRKLKGENHAWAGAGSESGVDWLHRCTAWRFEEVNDMFDREKLLTGDLLVYESGEMEMVVLNVLGSTDLRLPVRDMHLEHYNYLDDLNFDMMANIVGERVYKILRPTMAGHIVCFEDLERTHTCIWNRIKVMTMEEAIKTLTEHFGCEVEIVEGAETA